MAMLTLLTDLIRRTRQHHAIEHATIHVLAAKYPRRRFSGYSDPIDFTIYGEVEDLVLRRAVGDALLRLQAGEHSLAKHPNCGTNLAVTAFLVTLVALMAGQLRRGLLDRFALTLLFVMPVLTLSRPLGHRAQDYTTLSDVSDRWLAEIRPIQIGELSAYRVLFE